MLIVVLVGTKVLVATLVGAAMAEEEVEAAAKEKAADDDMAEILLFKKIGKNVFFVKILNLLKKKEKENFFGKKMYGTIFIF
jgi:hypothetical protein